MGIIGWIEGVTSNPRFLLAVDVITFISNLIEIYQTGVYANYYFFFAGHTIGAVIMDTFSIVNYYAGWISPDAMPQYERYDPNHAFDPNSYDDGWEEANGKSE